MKKIEIASNEQLKFNKQIEIYFIDKIIPSEALITDESRLTDFISMFDISKSTKKLDNGLYRFEFQVSKDLNFKDYEIKIVEEEGVNDKEIMIEKIKKLFGVDISEKFNLTFPELFKYLRKEMKKVVKIDLGLI